MNLENLCNEVKMLASATGEFLKTEQAALKKKKILNLKGHGTM